MLPTGPFVVQTEFRDGRVEDSPRAQAYVARQQDRRVPGGARRVRHAPRPAPCRRAGHRAGPCRNSPDEGHRGNRPRLSRRRGQHGHGRRMLFEVVGERPGADLIQAPRTVPLPLAFVGITVAALAEAMQVRAANEPPGHLGDVITTYAQTLSGLGQITAGAAPKQAGNSAEILFPPALLRRAARYISGAADLAANGGKLPDGIPETARNQLAATLRRDADGLIAIAITTTD